MIYASDFNLQVTYVDQCGQSIPAFMTATISNIL